MGEPPRARRVGRADLHLHTRYSDGRDGPEAVLARAARRGLDVVAITDHDTMEGSLIAAELAARSPGGPAVVPGLEVTTSSGHVVGLYLREPVEAGMTPAQTVAAIHEQGGLAMAPHPFWRPGDSTRGGGVGREALEEIPFDAVEVVNGGPVPSMWRANRRMRALRESGRLGGAPLGGSDAHVAAAVGWAHTLFEGSGPEELRRAIEKGATRPARIFPNPVHLVRYGAWGLAGDPRLLRDMLPF